MILSSFVLAAVSAAATPTRPPLVVRVETELVQVDAVVLDKKNQHVTDLKAEDFEIIEGGKPQPLDYCQYIAVESPVLAVTKGQRPSPAPPPRREDIKRVIVLVVDDLGLSTEGMALTKEALITFVDTQMGTADLVAVVRTGGGIGVLEQLTTDKTLLRASIAQLRYNGLAMQAKSPRQIVEERTTAGYDPGSGELAQESLRRQVLVQQRLRTLKAIARGLIPMPGRRSMVVFSNTMALRYQTIAVDPNAFDQPANEVDAGILHEMRDMTETASRAAVVIHVVDPRSAANVLTFRSEMSSGYRPRRRVDGSMMGASELPLEERRLRESDKWDDHAGLGRMADETGGTFQPGIADAPAALTRVMRDLEGYYLLGYAPRMLKDADDRRRYHELTVRVKRPGLRVRARKGYFGTTDEEREGAAQASTDLAATAGSPFAATDLGVALTALFGHDGEKGSVLNTTVHVDAERLTFAPQEDGSVRLELEVLTFAFGDHGVEGETVARQVTLPLSTERADRLKRHGLDLEASLPVKRPGAYQVRAVVKDTASSRTGTTSRFLTVPDLEKRRPALSGITLTDPRVPPGGTLTYTFAVYQAKLDAGGDPRLTIQVRLSRNGQLLHEGEAVPLQPTRRLDLQSKELVAFACGGALKLTAGAPFGPYTLDVIVTDTLARKDRATATETAEFRVVPSAEDNP